MSPVKKCKAVRSSQGVVSEMGPCSKTFGVSMCQEGLGTQLCRPKRNLKPGDAVGNCP